MSPSCTTVRCSTSTPAPNRIRNATRVCVAASNWATVCPYQSSCSSRAAPARPTRRGHATWSSRCPATATAGIGRWSTARSRWSGCRGARTPPPLRVVDARDDPFHPERLAGDTCGDDVRVVARGHRGERVGPLDPRLHEHVAVEPHAQHDRSGKVRAQPTERGAFPVDDGDLVPDPDQRQRQRRSDTTTPHHDDVHRYLVSDPRGEPLAAAVITSRLAAVITSRLAAVITSNGTATDS